jgi:two-component system NtrC family response regulator
VNFPLATILVVVDDATLGEVLAKVLTRPGRCAVSVSSTSLALRLVEHEWPHLVLLDMCRRDGAALELAAAIRNSSHDLPLIVLTAFPHQKSSFPVSSSRFVTKSINLSDLRRTVDVELFRADAGRRTQSFAFPHKPVPELPRRLTSSVSR